MQYQTIIYISYMIWYRITLAIKYSLLILVIIIEGTYMFTLNSERDECQSRKGRNEGKIKGNWEYLILRSGELEWYEHK